MNLFGKHLDGPEIASLVFMLMALVLWLGALRDTRGYERWFRNWEAARKARRDAERRAKGEDMPTDTTSSSDKTKPSGPWG